MTPQEITLLRDLAKQYCDISHDPVQNERRDLWRRHNSLKRTRPLIYIRAFAWREMADSKCQIEDRFFRSYEDFFRRHLFWHTFGDDSIFEPWITVPAVRVCSGWGLRGERHFSEQPGGSFKIDYPIKDLGDIDKLRVPWHEIDEEKTAENVARVQDALGDILTVNVDRGPAYRMWSADISTDLGYLRGIEHFMLDMSENADWLHRLSQFFSSSVLKTHKEAEDAGDWGLCAHQNQAMPYAEELKDPAPNVNGIKRSDLWWFAAAQEFTGVSPAMHEEFLLRYQLPIMSQFGLVAYGCCEDLTQKIDMLRQVPNLRRIGVAPMADVGRCAEQIGQDYVLSYRPSPTDMVGYGFDPDWIRGALKKDLEACGDCHVDITLKDVETVQGDPDRIRNWVTIAREVIDELFG